MSRKRRVQESCAVTQEIFTNSGTVPDCGHPNPNCLSSTLTLISPPMMLFLFGWHHSLTKLINHESPLWNNLQTELQCASPTNSWALHRLFVQTENTSLSKILFCFLLSTYFSWLFLFSTSSLWLPVPCILNMNQIWLTPHQFFNGMHLNMPVLMI